MTECNARFWTKVNFGPVKLTLRPGQILRWGRHIQREDGWSSTKVTWRCWSYPAEVVQTTESSGAYPESRHSSLAMTWYRKSQQYLPFGDLPKLEYGEVVYPTWRERWKYETDSPRSGGRDER
jgi:hypothetical protein